MTAAYVGLVHAETEATLESTVQNLLKHGENCAAAGYCHPVLMNAAIYYQSQLQENMGIVLVPKRKELKVDAQLLLDSWRGSGASSYWSQQIDQNHGTGLSYIERLVQPLGLDLQTNTFKRFEGKGVVRLAQMNKSIFTDLNELVSLRGRAVHANSSIFEASVRTSTPAQVSESAKRATNLVQLVVSRALQTMW
ncbi:hypothetical protein [Arthrobacter agilis]|uniref:hypothetical protein n=1 Tax=Arthrobacter agilis TaxID=37921 RepID=UPI001ABF8435|nr:hypothetical protein [Arthrobacter agilis]